MEFDYENELKINNLARDILKQARVSGSMSTADAYTKAKEIILGSQGNTQPTGASQPSPSVQAQPDPTPRRDASSSPSVRDTKNDALIQQLVESNKNLSSEIANIQSKINEMVAEFNKINGEIAGLKKGAIVQQQMTQRAAESPRTTESHSEEPVTQGKGSFDSGAKSTHPRSGGYSSADVDINKMFYMGNK